MSLRDAIPFLWDHLPLGPMLRVVEAVGRDARDLLDDREFLAAAQQRLALKRRLKSHHDLARKLKAARCGECGKRTTHPVCVHCRHNPVNVLAMLTRGDIEALRLLVNESLPPAVRVSRKSLFARATMVRRGRFGVHLFWKRHVIVAIGKCVQERAARQKGSVRAHSETKLKLNENCAP